MTNGWQSFPRDPRLAALAEQRASDAERASLLALISEAYADGRLDREEFDERSQAATTVKTLGEMPPLVGDLIPEHTPVPVADASAVRAEAERRYRSGRTEALMAFLWPTIIVWTIWAASGMGFPWPVFVTLAVGGNMLRVLLNRQGIIEQNMAKIEEKQAAKLAKQERRALTEREQAQDS